MHSQASNTANLASELNPNPYKELVEKYEALLEVQRNKRAAISLQEELAGVGGFGDKQNNATSNATTTGAVPKDNRKTPTSISDSETLSSGFLESLNDDVLFTKSTQTEEGLINAMVSIYKADGTDLIESRFKNRPEYKELFKEIFGTLKQLSESKEIAQLAVEDDKEAEKFSSIYNMFEVLSVDENESVMSEQSIMSEVITKVERKNLKKLKKAAEKESNQKAPVLVKGLADGRLVTPYNRDPLEDIISNIERKKRARRSRTKKSKLLGKAAGGSSSSINTTWERSDSPTPSLVEKYKNETSSEVEFKPSSASKELHKLKKLDLSYAEVLRRADTRSDGNRSNSHHSAKNHRGSSNNHK